MSKGEISDGDGSEEVEAKAEKSEGEKAEEDEELDKATEMAGLQKFKLRSEQLSEERRHTPSPEARARDTAASPSRRSRENGRGSKGAKGKGKGGGRVLNSSKRRLDDEGLMRLAKECEEDYDEIDLSRNNLTSEGASQILEICKKSPDLKVLKLFNNQLGDECAEELGEIFKHCQTIEEVHLSHNNFTETAVEVMVKAANRELPRKAERPLWLRMEHNKAQNTESLARDIERHYPAVCAREDRARCTPRVCAMGKRIHLPFLIEAPKGKGRGRPPRNQGGKGHGRRRGDSRRRRSPLRRPRSRRRSRPSRSRQRASPPRLRSAPRHKRKVSRTPSPSPPKSRRRAAPSPRWPSPEPRPESEPESMESEASEVSERISPKELPAEVTKLRPKARPRPKVRAAAPPPVRSVRLAVPKAMPEDEEYSYYSDYEYEYSYA